MRRGSGVALAITAAALVGGGVACGGKGGAAPAPTLSGQPVADPADQLMAFVPPDASFVLLRDQQAGISDAFSPAGQTVKAIAELRTMLDPAAGPGSAFVAALADALLDPASSPSATIGWREGESALAAYGLGIDTVIRMALDGARLRATLERAAAVSHFPLIAARWHDRPYYRIEIPTPAFSIWLLLRVDDHGAVAAFTGDPDRLVDHVMAERPSGPRFDAAAAVAATYPDRRGEARFAGAIYPARLAAALDKVVARHPPWLAVFEDCPAHAVDLLAATPSLTMGWVPNRGRFEGIAALAVDDRTVERLAHDQRAIPRWSTNDHGMQVGLGVGPRTLIAVSEPWLNAYDRMATACGSRGAVMTSMRAMVAAPAVARVDAAVIEWDPRSKSMAAAVGARDLKALWAGLRTLVPLRAQPLAPMEQVTFQGMVLMGGVDALGVGGGDGAAAAITALMAAGPGPREIAALHFGRALIDEARRDAAGAWGGADVSSMDVHLRVHGRRLLLEIAATTGSSLAR